MISSGSNTSVHDLVHVHGLAKYYPGVQALAGIDFTVRPGEIHALVGENGAGKSTLLRILSGQTAPDAGTVEIGGVALRRFTPATAIAAGVGLVPQDIIDVPLMTLLRNVALGTERPLVARTRPSPAVRRKISTVMRRLSIELPLDELAGVSSIAERRLSQIVRAVARESRVLILDEPTAMLSEVDAAHLLGLLRELADLGVGIIYVSHRLREVLAYADRVSVLRDGELVLSAPAVDMDRDQLLEAMARRRPSETHGTAVSTTEATESLAGSAPQIMLEVSGLRTVGFASPVDLVVRAGEIVGIAAGPGARHGNLLAAIAGVHGRDGVVLADGVLLAPGSIRAATRARLRLVPADRRGAGVLVHRSVQENIALSAGRLTSRWGWRARGRERELARTQVERLGVHPQDVTARVGQLSGGNQQKVAIACALASGARILLIDEPTQGVDVQARLELHRVLRELAADGCAIVIASSDLDEILTVSDTVMTYRDGQLSPPQTARTVGYDDLLSRTAG